MEHCHHPVPHRCTIPNTSRFGGSDCRFCTRGETQKASTTTKNCQCVFHLGINTGSSQIYSVMAWLENDPQPQLNAVWMGGGFSQLQFAVFAVAHYNVVTSKTSAFFYIYSYTFGNMLLDYVWGIIAILF